MKNKIYIPLIPPPPLTMASVLRKSVESYNLTEVLITIAIIGIIAALTLQTLISKAHDFAYKKAWKGIYIDLSNAYTLALAEKSIDFSGYGPYGIGTLGCAPTTYYGIFSHLKTIEMCVNDAGTNTIPEERDCLKKPTKHYGYNIYGISGLNGFPPKRCTSGWTDCGGSGAAYSARGGVAVLENSAQIYAMDYMWDCPLLTVDVNGVGTGPDIVGKDIFVIKIGKNRLIPGGAPAFPASGCSPDEGHTSGAHGTPKFSGSGCGYKYLYE